MGKKQHYIPRTNTTKVRVVKAQKVGVPVDDLDTRRNVLVLVAQLEIIQELLDTLEGVNLMQGAVKKATKDMQEALAKVIKHWYEHNLTLATKEATAETQTHFAVIGKYLQDAIKAVLKQPEVWAFVPAMIAPPKPLPADKVEDVKSKVKLFFLMTATKTDFLREGVGEEVQQYIKALVEKAMLDYLENPAQETPAQIAYRVFEYYFYSVRNAPIGKVNVAQRFSEFFNDFQP